MDVSTRPKKLKNLPEYVKRHKKSRKEISRFTDLRDKTVITSTENAGKTVVARTPFTAFSNRKEEKELEVAAYLNDQYPGLFKQDYQHYMPYIDHRQKEQEALRKQEFLLNIIPKDNAFLREKIMKTYPEIEQARIDTVDRMADFLKTLCRITIMGPVTQEDWDLVMQIAQGDVTWNQEALAVALGTHDSMTQVDGEAEGAPITAREQSALGGVFKSMKIPDLDNLFNVSDEGKMGIKTRDDKIKEVNFLKGITTMLGKVWGGTVEVESNEDSD